MNQLVHRSIRFAAQALLSFLIAALWTTETLHAADPVCIYQSKSYSEGAFICVQKSLMQTCGLDGNRPVWRIVGDKDIGDRCAMPLRSETRKRIVRRARMVRHVVPPTEPASAKCFMFNGKRYCE